MTLRRPCKDCSNMFYPGGPECWLCDNCLKKRKDKTKNKIRQEKKEEWKIIYFEKKKELDNIRDNATLENWKILSEAYNIGKKVWGNNFSRQRLSTDMEMPYTTVIRCLSLDRAHHAHWKLVKEGKLSVFKLAMICCSKNKNFRTEIIKMVVENNLSTTQIKTLHINNIKDIKKEKHRLAIENGYSLKSSAYYNFNSWVNRGKLFLLMNTDHLPQNKLPEIKDNLEVLNKNIKIYLKNLSLEKTQ